MQSQSTPEDSPYSNRPLPSSSPEESYADRPLPSSTSSFPPHHDHHNRRTFSAQTRSRTSTSTSFLSEILPSPNHPRAQRRSIASGIIFLWFAFILTTCLYSVGGGGGGEGGNGNGKENRVGEWTRYDYVVRMGMKSDRVKSSSASSELGVGMEDQIEMNGVDGMSDEDYEDEMKMEELENESQSKNGTTVISSGTKSNAGSMKMMNVTIKSEMKELSQTINGAMLEGQLSDYHWHAAAPALTDQNKTRTIIIGDIHGSIFQLNALLARLNYNSTRDNLFHVGDLMSKSTTNQSLAVVQRMRTLRAKGVRGNHDQGILDWRTWMELMAGGVQGELGLTNDEEVDVGSKSSKDLTAATSRGHPVTPGISATLKRKVGDEPEENEEDDEVIVEVEEDAEVIIEEQEINTVVLNGPPLANLTSLLSALPVKPSTKSAPHSTLFNATHLSTPFNASAHSFLSANLSALAEYGIEIPTGWDWQGSWFNIALALSPEDVEYLRALPLTIWIEEVNAIIVHAGLVPGSTLSSSSSSNVTKLLFAGLSPRPSFLSSSSTSNYVPSASASSYLRSTSRAFLLLAQNANPFTLLNMRTLSRKGTKSNGLPPTSDDWKVSKKGLSNKSSGKREAWNKVWDLSTRNQTRPVNVMYGHWAGEGLMIRNTTFGLDSGCAYGRRLSSLILKSATSKKRQTSEEIDIESEDEDEDDAPSSVAGVKENMFVRQEVMIDGKPAEIFSRSCSDRV